VRIDTPEPWADSFRRVLRFWNTVLAANLHEETTLDSCAVRIINAGPDILNKAVVARSQLTEWDNCRGKIAVSPGAAKVMSSTERCTAGSSFGVIWPSHGQKHRDLLRWHGE
jgi:hypothetical protein